MKGRYHIIVENKRIKYEFDIQRNITIVRGDSATGKTTLLNMIEAYQAEQESSGVSVIADCLLEVLTSVEWKYRIERAHNTIFFIEECNRFVVTKEFAEAVKKADAYFVLIQRESLPNLPYSVDEIYGIHTSNRYGGFKKTYNEFYHLYGDGMSNVTENIDVVVTEDSNSGYQFFDHKCRTAVMSAEGKSNIGKMIRKYRDKCMLVIADGAAFGPEMEAIMRLQEDGYCLICYLPESFEWLLLSADLLNDKDIRTLLMSPENYIDSREYISWERFFTKVLIEKSKDTYMRYEKRTLNRAYCQERIREKVIAVLPEVIKYMFE
mgnify:CR=1 FL=1